MSSRLASYRSQGTKWVQIIEVIDAHTCEFCKEVHEKAIDIHYAVPSVTVPPFHPYCRGTVISISEITDLLSRGIKWEEEEESPYVSLKSLRKWVRDNPKELPTMGNYRRQDGSFDLEAAREDYRNFLQIVPDEDRIYLEMALDGVEYEETDDPNVEFGYSGRKDVFLYNLSAKDFNRTSLYTVFTHELGHWIDQHFVESWKNEDFSRAIREAGKIIDENPDFFKQYSKENDKEGFLSDIMSAICKGKYKFEFRHDPDYWLEKDNQEKEIFANLYSLKTWQDSEKLEFIQKYFPDIYSRVYSNMPEL